jgi:hypothetical protein
MRRDGGPSLPEGRQVVGHDPGDPRLALHAAERAAPAGALDLRGACRIEFPVIRVDQADFRAPRIVAPHFLRIGDRGLHPGHDLLR